MKDNFAVLGQYKCLQISIFLIVISSHCYFSTSVWKGNMQAKAYARSRWYTAAFALRQRMLNFVQNFEYYMMFEVIEPNWHDFQQNMAKVNDDFCWNQGYGFSDAGIICKSAELAFPPPTLLWNSKEVFSSIFMWDLKDE